MKEKSDIKEKSEPTYREALAELEGLIEKIESPETPLEEVTEEVKRALELIKFCREKIKGEEESISKLIE